MSKALFPQIKPLSSKPTPAELADFSRSVRAALFALQTVPQQLVELDAQITAAENASTASVVATGYTEVVEAPTTAAGLVVTGLFAKIMLQWDAATYQGHAYTEIWRGQVDDLGLAVRVDKEQFHLWTDANLPDSALGEVYYYWIRHVNKNGDEGAFNAVEGTPGSTADDPDYVLEILTGEISESELLTSLSERIDLIDTAGTGLVDGLAQEITDRGTAVSNEATARGTADGALSESLVLVQAAIDDPDTGLPAAHSAVVDEAQARSDEDGALATDISTVTTTVNHPTTGLAAAHSAVQNEATARSDAVSAEALARETLEAVVDNPTTGLVVAHAAVQTEATARANADSAEVSARTTLAARVTTNEGDISGNLSAIQSEQTARANADSAMASDITTVEAVIDNATTGLVAAHTAVQTEATARANADGTLGAEYAIKVNVNGHVAGMGVAVSGGASGAISSEIIMLADKFAIVIPSAGAGEPVIIPFVVGTVNGVTKVVMSEAVIGDLTVDSAAIKLLAVDNGHISSLSASKFLAGVIKAANIYVGNSEQLHIDGVNERITVNDGTRDRVTFGYLGGGKWGLTVVNASGSTVINADGELSSSSIVGLGDLSTIDGFTLANISSYFDTLAIGEALIANLAVSTQKIKDDAVTVPISAFTAAVVNVNTSWVTVQTIADMNSEGQPVQINFSCVVYRNTSGTMSTESMTVYLRIIDDEGEQLGSQEVMKVERVQQGSSYFWRLRDVLPFTWSYSPTTGDRDISIQLKSTGYFAASSRSLNTQGVKK